MVLVSTNIQIRHLKVSKKIQFNNFYIKEFLSLNRLKLLLKIIMNFAYWNVFSAEIMIYLLQIYEIRHLLVFKNEKKILKLVF